MRRIATHCAIDQLNAARRRNWQQLDLVGQSQSGSTVLGRVPPSPTPTLGESGDPVLIAHIRRAFASLPPKLRVVATLALIEELPQTEIADALGVPIGTVKSRLFRATRDLRDHLTGLGIQV